jgi:hypothetical protein
MHAVCPLSGANATLGRIYAHTPKPQAVEAKDRGPGSSSWDPRAVQPAVSAASISRRIAAFDMLLDGPTETDRFGHFA